MRSRKFRLIMAAVCVALILCTALLSSLIQTSGGRVEIIQVTDQSNTGFKTITAADTGKEADYAVNGHVASGLLYVPKNAHTTPAPGIVMTHGAFNNKEMQESFAIEMARRGYVVLIVDSANHGDNEEAGDDWSMSGNFLLNAAKYLYNLTDSNGRQLVDRDKIAVSGHSMGGGYTNGALKLDGVDTEGAGFEGATEEALNAGYHMGIFSAGIPEAADPDNSSYGSNLLGVGNIKGSADEWYYNSELKEPEYIMISKDFMSQEIFNQGIAGTYQAVYAYNPTSFSMQWSGSIDGHLYVKQGGKYVPVDSSMSFDPDTQYYKYDTHGNAIYFLRSAEAMAFVDSSFDPAAFTGSAYQVQNKGIYDFATGQLVASQEENSLLSIQTKGEQQASETVQIRALYEAHETHPMNHFSIPSTANYIDFFYNVFGVPEGAKFISPNSQTWIVKQCLSFFGFLGMFGLVIVLADILLDTRAFGKLAVKPEELPALPSFKKNPRKIIRYAVIALGTCLFSAYSYSQINNNGKWFAHSFLYDVLQNNVLKITNEGYYIFYNVGMIAYWALVCGFFAVALTGAVWLVSRIIDMIIYKDDYRAHDEHPFEGFRIRSWGNVLRTLGLVVIICTVFFYIVNLMWRRGSVGFYFWTFGLRHFDADKLPSMIRYMPIFACYYVVNAALGPGYRVKELPEWLSTLLNVLFNVVGVLILVWAHNIHNLTYGNMSSYGNSLMYLLAYPIIPSVAFATILGRRLYLRTGNGWLGGLINTVIMTIMACANTGFGAIL